MIWFQKIKKQFWGRGLDGSARTPAMHEADSSPLTWEEILSFRFRPKETAKAGVGPSCLFEVKINRSDSSFQEKNKKFWTLQFYVATPARPPSMLETSISPCSFNREQATWEFLIASCTCPVQRKQIRNFSLLPTLSGRNHLFNDIAGFFHHSFPAPSPRMDLVLVF